MLLFSGRRESGHPTAHAHALALGIASLTMLLLPHPAQAVSFIAFGGAGDLTGIAANDVSADGTVVAGAAMIGGRLQAFRWQLFQGPMVGLGNLTGGSESSSGRAVSADGTTVVGSSRKPSGAIEAFKWDASDGMVGIHDGTDSSYAAGVSADGSVIAVDAQSGNYLLHGDGTKTGVLLENLWNLSDDGLLVPGWYSDGDQAVAGVQGLAALDIYIFFEDEYATAVSADGSIVTGWVDHNASDEPLRWVNGEPEVILGPGGEFGEGRAYDVTPDGSTIVGIWDEFGIPPFQEPGKAFIWDDVNGMRLIEDLAAADGIDLSGWRKMSANAISHDGLTVVGSGTNPDGDWEPWLFSLNNLPEPSTGFLISMALSFLVARDRCRL